MKTNTVLYLISAVMFLLWVIAIFCYNAEGPVHFLLFFAVMAFAVSVIHGKDKWEPPNHFDGY